MRTLSLLTACLVVGSLANAQKDNGTYSKDPYPRPAAAARTGRSTCDDPIQAVHDTFGAHSEYCACAAWTEGGRGRGGPCGADSSIASGSASRTLRSGWAGSWTAAETRW
jgi:hypothetical protein